MTQLVPILVRRDTAANWTSNNPVLAAGEIGYELDTKKFKMGDGARAWNDIKRYYRQPFKVLQNDSADQAIAKMQADSDFTFGTANAVAGAINITNLTQLAQYFNAFEDFTGMRSINSELQRYQPFNTTNHNFLTDQLVLDASGAANSPGWSTVNVTDFTSSQTIDTTLTSGNPTPIPIGNLGVSDTNTIFVGQIVVIQARGTYYVSAITAGVSVTLRACGGTTAAAFVGPGLIVWTSFCMAFIAANTTAATSSETSVTLKTPLPAQLVVGMQVGMTLNTTSTILLDRKGDFRVSAINQGTGVVTLQAQNGETAWMVANMTTSTDVTACGALVFGPPMPSAQIWSKQSWNLAGVDYQGVCWDGYFEMPPAPGTTDGGAFDTYNLNSQSSWLTVPSNVPWGCWPAFWLYTANSNGDGTINNNANTEMDITELWWDATKGPRAWTGNNIMKASPGQGSNYYVRTMSGETATNVGVNTGSTIVKYFAAPVTGTVRFTFIWTPEKTYRYVNGLLTKADHYEILGTNAQQFGVDLSVGSLNSGLAGNLLIPQQATNFSTMKFGIHRLRTFVAY